MIVKYYEKFNWLYNQFLKMSIFETYYRFMQSLRKRIGKVKYNYLCKLFNKNYLGEVEIEQLFKLTNLNSNTFKSKFKAETKKNFQRI
jgi:hypothetical protein